MGERMHFVTRLLLTLFCLVSISQSVAAADDQAGKNFKLVFTEFDDSSAGNYQYLRNSIQTMLASRLAANEKIVILDENLTSAELAGLRKGAPGQADMGGDSPDFLVDGAMYALKGGLNTQVVLYPFDGSQKAYRFSVLTQDTNTLIADVEKLAADIGSDAFGIKSEVAAAEAIQGREGGSSAFVTAHPEAEFKRKMYSGSIFVADEGNLEVKTIGGKKTTQIGDEMTTMTVADLDGDGQDEVLVLFSSRLELYRVLERRISKITEFKLPRDLKCHALNVADLNGDGKSEIYLSATHNLIISSLILNYAHESFSTEANRIPFLIRPVDIPGIGPVLAGQRKGRARTDFQAPGLFAVDRSENGSYVEGKPLPLPPSVNLFDFVFADLDGDKTMELVAVDKKERLKVYNSLNELLWVSKTTFGGSKIYIGPSMGAALDDRQTINKLTADEEAARELSFVPGRLLVVDANNDGRSEIVVNGQDGVSIPFFHRLRLYSSGYVVGLTWANEQLGELWRTGNFPGYLAGFGMSDVVYNENAASWKTRMKLFVGQVPDSGSLMSLLPGSSKSNLTVFEMEFFEAKEE